MAGIALFLEKVTKEKKKEYILEKISTKMQEHGIEILHLDMSAPDLFEQLNEKNSYMRTIPYTEKHIVFSLDGDGFCLNLLMDGRWVDNVPYNIFTYLTKHPGCFEEELSGVNSWYISVLNSMHSGVSYIENTYPHLDGAEYMVFPAFMGKHCDAEWKERGNDILLIADYSGEESLISSIREWSRNAVHVVIYGEGWQNTSVPDMEYIHVLPEEEQVYENKLELMGQSKITVFCHTAPEELSDVDVISAMANGSVVFTEENADFAELFQRNTEIMLYRADDRKQLTRQTALLLQNEREWQEVSAKAKSKAREIGDLSCFVNAILERCK